MNLGKQAQLQGELKLDQLHHEMGLKWIIGILADLCSAKSAQYEGRLPGSYRSRCLERDSKRLNKLYEELESN